MTAQQRVGSYEIVRVLARGGMAVVYLARQPALDREVALKQLDLEREDPTLAERFVREARLAAALDHPNVVTLFDFFEHGGVPYIAMEHVAGGSLRPLVGSLDLPQVIGVLEGILAGLGHAEAHGVAHRDLKPENVLITRGGTVKIADFGIARAYNAALTGQLTSTGTSIGTPAYMAPEQALDEPLGPSTDLYAVGVIAYELLAGRPPFESGGPPMAVLYRQVHTPPPPLAELAPGVPERVRDWVERLLAKDPTQRPASAAQAWEALEEIAVDELGPYWRRTATIVTPTPAREAVTTAVPGDEGPTVVVSAERPPRRRALALVAGVTALAGTAAVLALLIDDPGSPGAGAAVRAAEPYDFDGDGDRELMVGMARSSGTGRTVVRDDRGFIVITPRDAGLPPPYDADDLFGVSPASGDFDRDGHADLAIGAPGRDAVAVLYGSRRGLSGRRQTFALGDARMPRAAGAYGTKLLAADLNADDFADLAIGAPSNRPVPGTGAVQILFGSTRGLTGSRARSIRSPDASFAMFGSRMRAGDLNGDGRVDIVEGASDEPGVAGHGSYCAGSVDGPRSCRPLGEGGSSSLAVADVTGDDFGDVVQGDSDDAGGGVVRLWPGSRRGPEPEAIEITEDSPTVPGDALPGHEFGRAVDAGDLDGDGFADMIVGVPGYADGAGAFTVVRGGPDGHARDGHGHFDKGDPGVPGEPAPDERFGSGLGLLRLPGDDLLDVAVTSNGAARLVDAVYLFEAGPGIFVPAEADASRPLRRLDQLVDEPHMPGVRVGRGGDS
ncbi:MAG TPA: protein kinase [Solirubrobacteraceae bacterium]|nr:protein kinase [Solirubrobacteraceae bacterium]